LDDGDDQKLRVNPNLKFGFVKVKYADTPESRGAVLIGTYEHAEIMACFPGQKVKGGSDDCTGDKGKWAFNEFLLLVSQAMASTGSSTASGAESGQKPKILSAPLVPGPFIQ
jgi:hypothetical protein